MIVLILVVIFSLTYYAYFRRMRKPLYELSESLPDPGSLPVLGHTHWFIGGPERVLRNIKELATIVQDTGGLSKVWIGPSLYIVAMNPEDVQIILESCLQKDYSYKFLQAWLGNGLFVAPVETWKVHRRVLKPIFHNRIIEDYIDVFGEQGSVLVDRLEEKIGGSEFDAFKYITSCMLDIVFETAMGEKMDVQHNPDTPYLRARNTVMSIISMRLFKAWMQPEALFNLTPYSKIQKENIDLTHKFTDEAMASIYLWPTTEHGSLLIPDPTRPRAYCTALFQCGMVDSGQFNHDGTHAPLTLTTYHQDQVVKKKRALYESNSLDDATGRKDLLELLLTRDMKFTDEQLREHIDSITIAGNDTTALVISYALLLLGCHEDVQEKIYEELQGIFNGSKRSPTKEDLHKMELLERVLKETMRLYTVVPIIGRKTDKEIKLTNCTVPAGVGCAVVPFVMHRSKKIWGPDADSFKPDRFLPENSATRHPCAFIPFSYGTRNCIGRHFGMLAMKSILANVLRSYKVKSRACARLKIEILLFPVPGHLITIERR